MSENLEGQTNMGKQIKIGAIISYLSLIINTILALIYLPWMVSVIGKADYALYSLSLSLISIFMVDFGLSAAVSRFIAKYNAEGQENKVDQFIRTVETLYTIIASVILIALIIFFIFIERIYTGLSSEEIATFKMLYIIVMVYSIVSFPCMPFTGILNAYERFIELKICDLAQKLLHTILTVICLLLGGDVKAVVLCNVISGMFAIVIRYIVITKKTPVRIRVGKVDPVLFKEIFSFSIWITVISLAQRCIYNIAPSILGIVSNSDAIAVFAPANTLENFFYMLASAVNGLFLPLIARYIADDDNDRIYELMVKVGRYQFVLLSFAFVGFLCVGEEFMVAWMGEGFIKTYPCVLLLFLPDILLFTQQIANTTAIAKNKVKQQAWGYIGMALICVGVSFSLCGRLGALGSAVAISLSYVFLFVYLTVLYKKELGMDMGRFFKDCYLDLGLFIVIAAVLSYVACAFITIDSRWISIIVKAVITSVIYISIIFVRLNSEEKAYIKRIVNRIGIKKR